MDRPAIVVGIVLAMLETKMIVKVVKVIRVRVIAHTDMLVITKTAITLVEARSVVFRGTHIAWMMKLAAIITGLIIMSVKIVIICVVQLDNRLYRMDIS